MGKYNYLVEAFIRYYF